MKMKKLRPYCVQLQAQQVIEHALYMVRMAVVNHGPARICKEAVLVQTHILPPPRRPNRGSIFRVEFRKRGIVVTTWLWLSASIIRKFRSKVWLQQDKSFELPKEL